MTMKDSLSKTELLTWLNNLLSLNYTKVEQCGTGAAYCQIMDSLYYDIPMSKVHFNGHSEIIYYQNFKILQRSFVRHGIDRDMDVEKLVKCRLLDNLGLLQWCHKYWIDKVNNDSNYGYDAEYRRRKSPGGSQAALGSNYNDRRPSSGNIRDRNRNSVTGSIMSRRSSTASSQTTPGSFRNNLKRTSTRRTSNSGSPLQSRKGSHPQSTSGLSPLALKFKRNSVDSNEAAGQPSPQLQKAHNDHMVVTPISILEETQQDTIPTPNNHEVSQDRVDSRSSIKKLKQGISDINISDPIISEQTTTPIQEYDFLISKQLKQTTSTIIKLESESQELTDTLQFLETERNFYYNKLRTIEIYLQTMSDDLGLEKQNSYPIKLQKLIGDYIIVGPSTKKWSITSLLAQVQEAMYRTEEGFQIPSMN